MLQIKINKKVFYDDFTCKFIEIDERIIKLEHSLASLAQWESKWHRSFLSKEEKTTEQTIDYVRCMIVEGDTGGIPVEVLLADYFPQINDYISDDMTATRFSANGRPSREIITAEVIYYWMISLGIPFECQYWHLNRLLTLIRVCSVKNAPPKKMSRKDIYKQNAALNASRRARMGTKG